VIYSLPKLDEATRREIIENPMESRSDSCDPSRPTPYFRRKSDAHPSPWYKSDAHPFPWYKSDAHPSPWYKSDAHPSPWYKSDSCLSSAPCESDALPRAPPAPEPSAPAPPRALRAVPGRPPHAVTHATPAVRRVQRGSTRPHTRGLCVRSFYFVGDKMVMHNKAEYCYVEGAGE
jgi:hypothetical protein